MVAVIALLPVLVAVNTGKFPVPDAAKPMAGFELVHLMYVPAEAEKAGGDTETPLQAVMLPGCARVHWEYIFLDKPNSRQNASKILLIN